MAEGAKLALVDVVVNARGEANVRVDEEGSAEDTVEDGLGLGWTGGEMRRWED